MAKKSVKKRKHPGITEKRLGNRRFRRTEDAIIKAFFECGQYAAAEKIARRAGVARSTIYYHHQAVSEILPNYKKYIIKSYTRMIGKLLKQKQAKMKQVFLSLLTFIMRNRSIFMIFAKAHDTEVMRTMVERLRSKVESFARLPKNSEQTFQIYKGEIVALLEKWGEQGYREKEMPTMLGNMMYLTETARARLSPLT